MRDVALLLSVADQLTIPPQWLDLSQPSAPTASHSPRHTGLQRLGGPQSHYARATDIAVTTTQHLADNHTTPGPERLSIQGNLYHATATATATYAAAKQSDRHTAHTLITHRVRTPRRRQTPAHHQAPSPILDRRSPRLRNPRGRPHLTSRSREQPTRPPQRGSPSGQGIPPAPAPAWVLAQFLEAVGDLHSTRRRSLTGISRETPRTSPKNGRAAHGGPCAARPGFFVSPRGRL